VADQQEVSPEDKFRDALKDVLVIAKRLAPHCRTTEELIGVLDHALQNDGQLRLLMTKI
jgi:hypothetical protein